MTATPPARLDLIEGGTPVEVTLTGNQASLLAATKVVRLSPGRRAGLWLVRDNALVGTARIGTAPDAVTINIRPKVTIDRLLFLIGFTQRAGTWRQEEVDASAHPQLLPAVAHAFARAAERALRPGVLLGYTSIDDTSQVVRGRIRHPEQVRRRFGQVSPIEVRFDDYSPDIPENQLLLAAADRLLRLPGLPPAVTAELRRISARLPGVRRLVPGRALPAWAPNRLNSRYHTALGLADLVLRGRSFELENGGRRITVDGLLVAMWQVFEDFVTVAMSEALQRLGGRCQPQDSRHFLDHGRRIKLKPDLVYYRPDELGRQTPIGVLDAKYKRSAENADIYQMLAYCTRLGLRQGHLVYGAGEADTLEHQLCTERTITVVQHVLDLSGSPDSLLQRIEQIATELAIGADGPYLAAATA
ncbi:McrC family protein [Micromonospora chersina]|uniref:McrC family protein n=1 Tax=Micromonospora chersina TaxID=47854 RepID=UPI00371FC482